MGLIMELWKHNWRAPVEMVEIFHCRFVRIDVEHVRLESRVCQQFVCHVGQVNTHYGKGVPEHNTENLRSLREKKKMPSTIVSSTLESKYELV